MKEGIYAVYKPVGPTSHDIVRAIWEMANKKRVKFRTTRKSGVKVGHAGTLDPLASGVLIVGVGRDATKKLNILTKAEKEYMARIILGKTSTTDDEEGKKIMISDKKVSRKEVELTIKKFIGPILQTPPVYSAIKVGGVEAYKLVRSGKRPVLKSREVFIKSIELVSYHWPLLTLKVITGSGVYIRSLARDIGEELRVGAYLTGLERTRVGKFGIKETFSMDNLEERYSQK